jgi:hypothetical protein
MAQHTGQGQKQPTDNAVGKTNTSDSKKNLVLETERQAVRSSNQLRKRSKRDNKETEQQLNRYHLNTVCQLRPDGLKVAQIPGMGNCAWQVGPGGICTAVLPPKWEEEVYCSPCLLDSLK